MATQFTNRVVVIPKNEDADQSASLRVTADTEKGTVSIAKANWGSQSEVVEFPKQFLPDVLAALTDIEGFLSR